jgi:aconitate hydratase
MGILPLQFIAGESAETLGLTGDEVFEITGIAALIEKFSSGARVKVRAKSSSGTKEFGAILRIDTPQEALYYANGGILQYVLRQLLAGSRETVEA